MTLSTSQDGLVRVYLAAFLRAPEKSGFDYWSTFFAKGTSLDDIATSIFVLPVVKEIYPTSLTNSQFVSLIYQNVFGKAADSDGLAYWSGQLATLTRGQLVSVMINTGLALPDTTPGKAFIANRYRAALNVVDQQLTSNVDLNPEDLKSAMASVTADATTLAGYNNDLSARIAKAVNSRGITYSDVAFSESSANDGSIAAPITLLLSGDTFKGNIGSKLGTVSNVPAGLTASLVKTSDTTADLTLSGKATSHGTANSIINLTVTLANADFTSGNASQLSGTTRSDIKATFADVVMSEAEGTLTMTGALPGNVVVDLELDKATLAGTTTLKLLSGAMSNVTAVDAAAAIKSATGTAPTLTLKGDDAANELAASTLGDTLQGRDGDDVLTGGSGVDKFVLEATLAANGTDTINGFQIGTGGDVLNLSAFLNKTGTSHVATQLSSSTSATAWSNGDVLAVQGYGLDEAGVAALFGAASVFAEPTAAGKAVVITADIVGDATVWYITNRTAVTTIEEAEVAQVATLVGVNNLELVPFVAANFA